LIQFRYLTGSDADRRAAAIREIGIPPKDLALFQAGTITRTRAVEELEAPGVLICLSGNPGSGKTTAAGYRLYLAGCGMFVKAARLSRWPRYDEAEMERLFTRNPIVIDDLGTEYQDAKGNFMAILDEVIDVRYDHSAPTIITTNLDATAFKERYGERIADRIRESGRFVSLSAASMRGKK
jgi:DNA replication protein DnaC